MGGAVPGLGFFAGMLVAPILVGLLVGGLERNCIYQKRSLSARILMHIFGIAVTAALWTMFAAFDNVRPWRLGLGRLGINDLSKVYLFLIGLSVLPWFVFGWLGRVVAYEYGSDRL